MDKTTKQVAVVAFSLGWASAGSICNWIIRQEEKRYKKLLNLAQLNYKVVERYVELADPAVTHQIISEVEFDFIVLDLQ